MTTGLGLNGGLLAFGKESTYGTAAARTNVVCINSDGLSCEEEMIVSECLHGDFQNIDDMYKGNVNVSGNFESEMRYEGYEYLLENLLGTKSSSETAAYVIDDDNKYIDFKEDAGSELTATIAASTYILGASSATAGTLCAAIKTALEAAGTGTYTVTHNKTTKLFDIAVSGVVSAVQFLWKTGTHGSDNSNDNAGSTLGYDTTADSASAANITADNTIESVYTTTYKRSADSDDLQTGLSMELLLDSNLSTAKSRLYTGIMISSMDFSVEPGGKLMMSAEVLGSQESLLNTETVSAITYTKKPIILAKNGSVSYGGSSESLVSAFSCTLGMNLKDDRYVIGSSLRKKPIPNGKIELTGTMTLEFEGKTKYDDFRNNTTRAIAITFTSPDYIVGTVPYSFTISFPTNKLTGSTPQISDSGLITVEIPFTAGGEDVNNKGVVITTVNSQYLS